MMELIEEEYMNSSESIIKIKLKDSCGNIFVGLVELKTGDEIK